MRHGLGFCRPRHRRTPQAGGGGAQVLAARLVGLLALVLCLPASVHALELAGPDESATAGFYRLSWNGPAAPARFELEEAAGADFRDARIVYIGADRARVFSGRRGGIYYYRLRAIGPDRAPGAWSRPLAVSVAHHPLARALGFFAAGALVFIATLVLIVGGALRDRRESRA